MSNYYTYHMEYLEDLEIERESEKCEEIRATFRDYVETTGDCDFDNFSLSGLKL